MLCIPSGVPLTLTQPGQHAPPTFQSGHVKRREMRTAHSAPQGCIESERDPLPESPDRILAIRISKADPTCTEVTLRIRAVLRRTVMGALTIDWKEWISGSLSAM